MTDTYVYLIHESDWDTDALLAGATAPGQPQDQDAQAGFDAHARFAEAVAQLGARVTGGDALQNSRHGGFVTPGSGDRKVEDAVYTDGPFTDTSEVITGFYAVEVENEDLARRVAALVPTGGRVEWRKVFPTS